MNAEKAMKILRQLKNDGYTIEEIAELLIPLKITIEILEELASKTRR
jgi:hypothetical protein